MVSDSLPRKCGDKTLIRSVKGPDIQNAECRYELSSETVDSIDIRRSINYLA